MNLHNTREHPSTLHFYVASHAVNCMGYLAAAFDVAHSPSLCAMRCMAVGAIQIGEATFSPSTVVSVGETKVRLFLVVLIVLSKLSNDCLM